MCGCRRRTITRVTGGERMGWDLVRSSRYLERAEQQQQQQRRQQQQYDGPVD